MLRPILLLAGALTLAGCLSTGGGTPEAVMVQKDRIVVRMSNGWPCVGFRNADTETATGWAGRLEGCPANYPYEVTLQEGTNPVRMVLEQAFGALGGENILSPRAVVEITGGRGKAWVFRSPRSEQ